MAQVTSVLPPTVASAVRTVAAASGLAPGADLAGGELLAGEPASGGGGDAVSGSHGGEADDCDGDSWTSHGWLLCSTYH